jgi:hypothetical protein
VCKPSRHDGGQCATRPAKFARPPRPRNPKFVAIGRTKEVMDLAVTFIARVAPFDEHCVGAQQK